MGFNSAFKVLKASSHYMISTNCVLYIHTD